MIFSAPPRHLRPELLDLDEAPFEEVKDSLQDVQRVNRYLSGYRVLLHHIGLFFDRHNSSQPLQILDAATGSADQPLEVVRYARRRGIPVQVTAIDINRKMLRFAQEEARGFSEIRFVQCDALNMPFAEGSFDVVMAFFVLHFFGDIDAVFKRIHDLLTPDGLFISETACLGEKSKIGGKLLRFAGHLGILPKINLLTTRQLEQVLEKSGFQLVDKIKFSENSDTEYTLFSKKA